MEHNSFQLYNKPDLKNPQLYEQLLNVLPGMILVTGKNDRIIYTNKNFSSVIDKNLAAENISMKEIINRADWDSWNENLFRLSSMNNNTNCVFTVKFNSAANTIKHVRLDGKVLERDNSGKPLSYFFTGEDISDAYKNDNDADNKGQEASALKNVISKTSAEKELELTVKDLDRSNKDLEEFAYIASHDLQEPLRKITAFSTRLAYRFGEQLGEEGKLYLNKITAAAGGMKDLIDDLLQISRTVDHSQPFTETDLNDILNQVIQNFDLKIEERGVQILCGRLPVIEALPSQMRQLFSNLLSNAIKFSSKKDEPPLINITSEEVSTEEKMSFSLPVSKTYYKITVKDNGIGFKQEFAEYIFKLFYRLNGKAEYPGNGIGLAICSKIVEKHNGVITAQSQPCEGSAFIIILPKMHDDNS